MAPESSLGLEILRNVARIASSTLDLDETLGQTISVIQNKMNVDACAIYLMDHEDPEPQLKLRASSGFPESHANKIFLKPGAGVTGWVAVNKATLALSDALKDPRFVYFAEIEEEKFQSMLSVPLLDQNECIGVINVHTLEQRNFTSQEIAILETISGQITGYIRNAITFQKSQQLLKEQTLLYDISLAIQGAPKLDHRLWILLTGITLGGGGGFNRAILFLMDETGKDLKGYMGLGPESPDEAGRIWSNLESEEKDALHWALKESNYEDFQNSPFNHWAQSLTIPLESPNHVVAETVMQKRPIIIKDAQEDPLVPEDFARALSAREFATVPLMPHQEALGVLLVDNRFNQEPISESNLRLLMRLATHVGWVIENSRLFTKLLESNRELLSTKELLIQSEKLAALGELSAEVAHEIKNPLVSIGGFARRLRDQLVQIAPDVKKVKSLEGLVRYSNIIVTEVQRLERLLEDILLYSKTDQLELESCNPVDLVQEVLTLFEPQIKEKGIEIQNQMTENLPSLKMDRKKIKQVFINIIFNAVETMHQGGHFAIQSLPPQTINNQEMVGIAFEDTGGGIDSETFENIFNPFFSTKESGTGLGLAISRKIMESHGGAIHVQNNINKGVTVYTYLPLQKTPDYNKN